MHAPPCGALHHNVVAPQSPGFGPHAARCGAEPWGCVRRRACTPTGCDKTDVAPSERVTPRTSPRFDPGANRAVLCGATAFCSTPFPVAGAESSTPQDTAPRPTGPWSRTLGFGVPPRCGEDTCTLGFCQQRETLTASGSSAEVNPRLPLHEAPLRALLSLTDHASISIGRSGKPLNRRSWVKNAVQPCSIAAAK